MALAPPTLADILTYCHEGPWDWIDARRSAGARIWGLNVQTGETWKIRPQEGDCSIGHEYWCGWDPQWLPRAATG